jgi:hypothetical protein
MNSNELISLKENKIKQRNEMLRLVELITKELEALDTVLSMLHNTDTQKNIVPTKYTTIRIESSQAEGYGSLTRNVMRAINQLPEVWDKNNLISIIGKVDEGSLAGCLVRLVRKKFIEIVQKGSGRRPTTYRKINKNTMFDKKE